MVDKGRNILPYKTQIDSGQTAATAHFAGRRWPRHFNPAILTCPVATALAVWLIPPDRLSPDDLTLPARILALGLLGGIAIDVLRRGVAELFRAEHLLMLSLVIVILTEVLQGRYSHIAFGNIASSSIAAIGIFATALALGSCLTPRPLPRAVSRLAVREYSADAIFHVLIVCFSLAMFNFALASGFSIDRLKEGLLADRWNAPWGRGRLGGWNAFRDFLVNFGYAVPALTVITAVRKKTWVHRYVGIGLACSAVFLVFLAQSGGRRLVVVAVGAAMLTWLCAHRRNLRLRHIVVASVLIVVAVVVLDFMLANRNAGFGRATYSVASLDRISVDDNFWSLSETLRIIPDRHAFVGFQHLIYVVMRPIPRVLWPEKPASSGFDLAQEVGARGVAFSITAIGEWYMSFGWIGVVLGGLALGWMARTWSQLLDSAGGLTMPVLYGLGVMALFLSIRGIEELVAMSYPILCWLGLDAALFPRRLVNMPVSTGISSHRAI